ERAEKCRSDIIKEHAAAVKAYPAIQQKAINELKRKLRQAAANLSPNSKDVKNRFGTSIYIQVKVEVMKRPPDEPETGRVDMHLRMLRSTSQKTMRVGEDSSLAYLLR